MKTGDKKIQFIDLQAQQSQIAKELMSVSIGFSTMASTS